MRAMILVVATAGIISACAPDNVYMPEAETIERRASMAYPWNGHGIYVDPETGCEYFYFRHGHSAIMSPRYSSDGVTVMGCRDATR